MTETRAMGTDASAATNAGRLLIAQPLPTNAESVSISNYCRSELTHAGARSGSSSCH